jgi:hypothetical protein
MRAEQPARVSVLTPRPGFLFWPRSSSIKVTQPVDSHSKELGSDYLRNRELTGLTNTSVFLILVTSQTRDLKTISSSPLFRWGLRRVRIPVLLMTVFTGVVDGVTAFQHFRRILGVGRVERFGRSVMQTMSERDPGLAVLID